MLTRNVMRVFLVITLFIVALDGRAEKPVWQLTSEERATFRANAIDPMVDGARTPEIIAPIELMAIVLATYSLLDNDRARQERFRRDWHTRGAADHLGAKFWEDLRTVVEPMIAVHQKTRREPGDGTPDCVATAEALILARATYGAEKFDRFLYEIVAPGAKWPASSSSPELLRRPEFWLDQWKWQEEGCR